jgi:hypothetical protein
VTYTDAAGNTFTKTFTLKRGEYAVNVGYSVQNTGAKPLELATFGQLKQSINLPRIVIPEAATLRCIPSVARRTPRLMRSTRNTNSTPSPITKT